MFLPDDQDPERAFQRIRSLPLEQATKEMLTLVSMCVRYSSDDEIRELRAEIAGLAAMPVVASAVDLIDGQLALREISGGAWS